MKPATAWLRLGVAVAAMALATLALLAPMLLALRFNKPLAAKISRAWHRSALKIIGVRVIVSGEAPRGRPLLFVANHVSWSDILVLGSVVEGSFIARADMEKWPLIGQLARLQRTVFVDRSRKGESARQAETIAQRLAEGDAMVLFAEGTTGDGVRLMPFKSTLFAAVHSALGKVDVGELTVQPVALAYTRLHGMPLGRFHQARAAWPGTVALWPHIFQFVADGAYDAEVVFCPPCSFTKDTGRKEMAGITRKAIRTAFSRTLRMR